MTTTSTGSIKPAPNLRVSLHTTSVVAEKVIAYLREQGGDPTREEADRLFHVRCDLYVSPERIDEVTATITDSGRYVFDLKFDRIGE